MSESRSPERKSIVLLSGGLDSTVMLALALSKGRQCVAVTFDYRQRNYAELESAKQIAHHYSVQHKLVTICPNTFSRSALVSNTQVPKDRTFSQIYQGGVPSTYVPGRNTLFLAYAVVQAEIYEAQEIYLGVNIIDRGGYVDSRPDYLLAFQNVINLATKQAVETTPPQLIVPFSKLHKRDIIKLGMSLKVPLRLTMSCYDPSLEGLHCGRCDACYLRKEGFIAAGQKDITNYLEQGLPLGAAELGDMV